MTDLFYILECQADGADAEVYLNDIPVIIRGPNHGRYFGAPVNHFLIDGINELSVIIKPGPTPSTARTGKDGVKTRHTASTEKFFARLCFQPAGTVLGGDDARELMRVDWPIKDERKDRDDFRELEYPMILSARLDLGKLYGEWAWQKAPKLTLDDKTRQEIFKALTDIRGAMASGNPQLFLAVSNIRLGELARAYDEPESRKRNIIKRGFVEDAQQEGFGFEPLDPDRFDLRLVADGRLVECIGTDWEPLIVQKPDKDGNVAYYDMMLCRLNTLWAIAR